LKKIKVFVSRVALSITNDAENP